MSINSTHDPKLCSWVDSAQTAGCDFPIQNLPFGRFRRPGKPAPRCGVAIGDQVLDLHLAAATAVFDAALKPLLTSLAAGDLNSFMGRSSAERGALRLALSQALQAGSPHQAALQACLVGQADVEMLLPCHIGDYTDFYTGIHHATAVGKLFRPDNPLLPNYEWVPIGYHGRSSSVVVSGTPIRRPSGQVKPADGPPRVMPTQRLDHELELGFLIGPGNALGEPIAISEAEDHLFGVTLFNDWSARDIQPWEYQPLGPFLAKNFGSTIAPWVVTMEALAPFRSPFERKAPYPQPLPYLDGESNRQQGQLDIQLEVLLQTPAMREAGQAPVSLARSSVREAAFWTAAQLVAHHTVSGCNLQPGDLLGSGTLSGPKPEQAGSMLELTQGGKQALTLPNGETRRFFEDGDTVMLRGWCERPGAARIGFGECSGTVLPAAA